MSTLFIQQLEHGILPVRGTPEAAGLDLFSPISGEIPPGGRSLIKTGLRMKIPAGHYGRIADRSSLANNYGIHVLGGVIDTDYRGEVGVILQNLGDQPFKFQAGERIAQLILERITIPVVLKADFLDATGRGESGFGSTGKTDLVELKAPAKPQIDPSTQSSDYGYFIDY